MEFLRAIGRFILTQFAILGFLLLAPAILVSVSLFTIAGGAGSNPGFLAFFYMAAGPFVSAVWTAFFMSLRRVLRTTTFGNRTAASCGMRVQIAGSAWHARKRSSTSGKSAETVAMRNKLRAASLRIACLKRNGKTGEEILGLLDGDDHEAVLFQASLDNMDELRACPAGSMGELVHKRNQRYLREAR